MKRCMMVLLALLALFAPSGPAGDARGAAANTKAGAPLLYKETGHTLAYGFRQFWESNGGLPVFGYPLTEVFVEDGRPVQYFERARLEWHASLGLVLAGHLGRWAAGQASDPAFARRG
ncbi:MAG TPA: sortase, partial [Herpetosiphonaceae bacterium]